MQEAPAGMTVTRALRRAARTMTLRSLHLHGSAGSTAESRDVRRILLVAPPAGSGDVVSAGIVAPLGLAAFARSLRAAGFEAEIYDMASSLSAESIRLHIEHALPHVVVAVAYTASAEAARDVLRAAKELVPGVFTAIVGAQTAQAPANSGQGRRRRFRRRRRRRGDRAWAARPPQGGRAGQADPRSLAPPDRRPVPPSAAWPAGDHGGECPGARSSTSSSPMRRRSSPES